MIDTEMVFTPISSLGDSIVTSPIERHFSKLCRRLHVPVSSALLPTVTDLYREDAAIVVTQYQNEIQLQQYIQQHRLSKIEGPPIFTVPCEHTFSCILWDEQWYTHYEIPFGFRYSGFNLPTSSASSQDLYQTLVTNPRYILTHTQWSNHHNVPIDMHSWRQGSGLDSLDHFQIIDLNAALSNNLLDFVDLILNAEEIHCVPSCVFCLVDSIVNKTQARLFYHDIRKNTVMRVNNRWNHHRWCIINYTNKLF